MSLLSAPFICLPHTAPSCFIRAHVLILNVFGQISFTSFLFTGIIYGIAVHVTQAIQSYVNIAASFRVISMICGTAARRYLASFQKSDWEIFVLCDYLAKSSTNYMQSSVEKSKLCIILKCGIID